MIDGASAAAHLCAAAERYLGAASTIPESRSADIAETRRLLKECADRLLQEDPQADTSVTMTAPEASGIPVLRRFADVLRPRPAGPPVAELSLLQSLTDASRAVSALAAWTPFYGDCRWSRPFIDSFAVGPIVGPRAAYHHPGLIVDLFLYGPRVDYPLHAHPAAEVYLPLVGGGNFTIGSRGRPWHIVPGTPVVHRPDEAHSVTVDDGPLFGLTFLRGDLDGPTWYRKPMSDESQPKMFPPLV